MRKSKSPKGQRKSVSKPYSKPRIVKELPQSELKRKIVVIAKKYDSYEDFERSPELQRLAFGFETGSTLELPLSVLYVLHQNHLDRIDPLPVDVKLEDTPPVHVTFIRNRYVLTEGYRRYLTAMETQQPLRAIVKIDDTTESKLELELKTNLRELYENTK